LMLRGPVTLKLQQDRNGMFRLAGRTPHQYTDKIFGGRHLFTASTRPIKLRRRHDKGLATVRTLNLTANFGSIHRQTFITITFEIYERHATLILILTNDISLAQAYITLQN